METAETRSQQMYETKGGTMSDQYLGEIRPTAFNFAPAGWAVCQGQLLPISQNSALFSLLGTQFGGNGTSTFALPNLQGTVVVGAGAGPGLTPYVVGNQGGAAQATIGTPQMPSHTHPPAANSAGGASTTPKASIWAAEMDGSSAFCSAYVAPPGNVTLPVTTALPVGGGQPLNLSQPTLTVNYIIALSGNFPQRS
jgi:microcystin-dependent protein